MGFDDAQRHRRRRWSGSARRSATARELVPAGGLVEGLREIKDDAEVSRIREAAHLADARADRGARAAGSRAAPRRRSRSTSRSTIRRHGAEAISFPPIVASGAHGALPHAVPRATVIEPGTLVTIDWGAQLDGYCSDCTRTFAAGGEPGDEERARLRARAARRRRRRSPRCARARPAARSTRSRATIIDAAGHAEHFGHGLGHGVGLEIHEGPRLSRLGETALAPGMVVTVEPGVYVPGRCGVRIEDLVVVTDDGAEVLNTLPKDLQVVD